jgi:serine/threonine-protein kinase
LTNDLRDRLQASLGHAYTLDRELGGGGMSRVFTATETALGRSVVVKVLPPELAAGVSTERFKREIAVAARLQHPHIVPLLSAGEMDGVPYFTMPFVQGESLRVRLARRGELPVSESLRILREIASALAYAHEHGVVHRDIKPDNVLFSGDVAMVADFGVAKALSASSNGDHGGVTSLGVALGTPAYMAPEQATADPTTDHRADVYAFGVLAYEMLTGQPPFTGRNPSQLLAAHVTELAEPVSRRRPNLPPALAALVMRCLEKRPADRPQSASEIVHALDDITTPSGGTQPTSAALRSVAAPVAAPVTTPAPVPRRDMRANLIVLGIVGVVLGVGGVALWRQGAAAGRATAVVTADSTRGQRIAVLPFENLGDSADAYFADGMTDAVRGKLTGLSAMQVIARASSVQYRGTAKSPAEIARELGVRYLLTGTVRWAKAPGAKSHVQVSPELVEIGSDGAASSRWQQPFDAELADVFRVQGEIAGKVAEAMRVAIGGTDQVGLAALPTKNPAAYDAFLRGEAFSAAGNAPPVLRRAIADYERAVQLDPTFADAWARLSDARSLLYTNGRPTPELARAAREAADRSLALSPSGARPRRALGNYFRLIESDSRRAVEEMEKARATAPNDAEIIATYGTVLSSAGRFEDAVRELRAAQQLDPRSPTPVSQLRIALIWLRRYDEARAATERLLVLAPTNPQSLEARAMVELGTGNLAEARRITKTAAPGVDPDALLAYFTTYWDLGWVLDDADQQRALALGVEPFDGDRANWAIVRAQLYGWRGDSARMRDWGDTAPRQFSAQMRDTPDDAQRRGFHGLALAYAGRKAEAIAEGERGVALLPAERDALGAPYQVHLLARIYLLVGEPEKALDLLEQLLARPYYLSPGWLRVDPTFASLRGNPRFERLSSSR